ncbi:hypothetical protein CBS101457_000008 [Exobasidium rhododendri]|nr:hypothetical protein CBS101457_000008 [Exobasidium rhododendri]
MSTNTAAVLLSPSSRLMLQNRGIPVPGFQQLLVRTAAVAINPSDWMLQEAGKHLPCILGSDIAGVVEVVGPQEEDASNSQQHSFQVGDRIAAFAGGAWSGKLEEGGFQTHVIVSRSSTIPLPADISLESASTLPMAMATAASALWVTLQLPRPRLGVGAKEGVLCGSDSTKKARTGILVYGASSAVGLACVQLAKSMDVIVFAVASKRHQDYVCRLGADYFLDRSDKDLVGSFVEAVTVANLSEPLSIGLDAISSSDSLLTAVSILEACTRNSQSGNPMRLAITLAWPEDLLRPSGITIERTSASHFHTNEENAAWLFNKYIPSCLVRGVLQPAPPVRIVGNGLESINEGLRMSKKGVSCEKLVVQIS